MTSQLQNLTNNKENVNIVFIEHVDSGKSTIAGLQKRKK